MRSAYGAKEIAIGQHCVTIVVDVANVMGSRPDGWWRDRAGAAVRLYAEVADLAASDRVVLPPGAVPPGAADPSGAGDLPGAGPPGAADPPEAGPPGFVMVLEGAAKAAAARISSAAPSAVVGDSAAPVEVRPGEVRVVLARGSGDDAIVAVVRALPGSRVVVTADRELRARCVAAGATVLGPGWLLGLLR
jgi:8-oxo-dGTP diphosphatase